MPIAPKGSSNSLATEDAKAYKKFCAAGRQFGEIARPAAQI
ncbi:hypothetical protein [Pedosphaera parvula]|nr:hypothetical protein [Pedosphaera parvula]